MAAWRILVKTAPDHDGLSRRHCHDGPSQPWRPLAHWSKQPTGAVMTCILNCPSSAATLTKYISIQISIQSLPKMLLICWTSHPSKVYHEEQLWDCIGENLWVKTINVSAVWWLFSFGVGKHWQIQSQICWSERPLFQGRFDQKAGTILTKMMGPSLPKCRAILTNGVWAILDSRGRHGSAVGGGRHGQGPPWPAPLHDLSLGIRCKVHLLPGQK